MRKKEVDGNFSFGNLEVKFSGSLILHKYSNSCFFIFVLNTFVCFNKHQRASCFLDTEHCSGKISQSKYYKVGIVFLVCMIDDINPAYKHRFFLWSLTLFCTKLNYCDVVCYREREREINSPILCLNQ